MTERKAKSTFVEFHPFFDCCHSASQRLREIEQSESNIVAADEDGYETALEEEIRRLVILAPIFAVATLESFINHYADYAIKGDSWRTAGEIQSLSLQSKWVVVPFLTCAEELDVDSSAFNEFKELVRVRNYLTHSKPIWVYNLQNHEHYKRNEQKFENRINDRSRIAKRADFIAINLVKALGEIDESDEFHHIVESHAIPIKKD